MILYSKDHEWARQEDIFVTVGVTNYAQDKMGDVVFVELPKIGDHLKKHAQCALIESVKAASEVYAPVEGEVYAVNTLLETEPEKVNSDPEGEGWLFKLRSVPQDSFKDLMTAEAYKAYTGS